MVVTLPQVSAFPLLFVYNLYSDTTADIEQEASAQMEQLLCLSR